MLLSSLLLNPIFGVAGILVNKENRAPLTNVKIIALISSIFNLFISLIIFILFDFSTNQFQFVQEYHEISYFDFYLGVDGLSIYFVLLTTIIIPISLLSNWTSISDDVESYVIIILLLQTLLLAVFLVLDILLFYIFFESILPPLFILIGVYGSDNRVKASFYLFLYTLFGSLFLLLSILAMSSIMSTTDLDTLFKGNFVYLTQLFLFYGIFLAFAVKTPTIFLNTWLLKAHVESPLGGSIILAAIVLKLSLYGIFRLILPILPKAYMEYTYLIYLIGVLTIIYASLSTLRTIDVKELIAYSSVSHAAVYLLAVFSNSLQGIEGGINLGLAHGLVSPGLFICAGGILYDRAHTRLIAFYRGVAQLMPLFVIFFFILCLSNCGAPLSLNFIGEFLSLYGVFERSSLFGVFASSSIVFSAAYTMYMYQKISFGGAYSKMFTINIPDLNKREFVVLLTLVVPTVLFGIYPAPILDGLHYSVTTLIYSFDLGLVNCDAPRTWGLYFQDSAIPQMEALVKLHDNVMYYLIAILFAVTWIQGAIIKSRITLLFLDYLRIFKDKCAPILEWVLHNPPKPHAFTCLPMQSSPTEGPSNTSEDGSPTEEPSNPSDDVTPTEEPLSPSDDVSPTEESSNRSGDVTPTEEPSNRSGDVSPTEESSESTGDLDETVNKLPSWFRNQVEGKIRLMNKLYDGNFSEFEAKTLIQQNKNTTDMLAQKLEQEGGTEREFDLLENEKGMNNLVKNVLQKRYPEYNLDSHWGTNDSSSKSAESSAQKSNEEVEEAKDKVEEAKDNIDKSTIGLLITPYSRILWIALSTYLNPLRPYLILITPLVLSALVYFNLFYLSELYTMLMNVAGVYVGSVIVILCTVIHLLVKMLLMIRRANNSVGLYNKLVNFVANSSFVMYFIILLVSVVIVYYSGNLSVF